jgi:hypothetical protein
LTAGTRRKTLKPGYREHTYTSLGNLTLYALWDVSDAVYEIYFIVADGAVAQNWDIAANTELYAQWTANTYTIILDKQGGMSLLETT